MSAYLHNADSFRTPLEYPSYCWSGFRIYDKVMLIIRVFAVAIWCPRADKLATTLLYRQGGVYFLGYILAVNLVDEIFQRHDISVLRSLCCQSIKIVVDSDKTDAEERENTLQIVTGFLVVTTKTR